MEKREWEWEAAGMKTETTAACEKSRPVPAEELAGIMSLAWSFTLSHMLSFSHWLALGPVRICYHASAPRQQRQ